MQQGLLLLPSEIMAADIRSVKSAGICRCFMSLTMEERKRMEKIKDLAGRLGERLFSDLPEKKRRRIAVQIIVGISLALVCMAGMGIFRYKAVKPLEKNQAIADAYAQLDIILEEGREQSQKEAAAESPAPWRQRLDRAAAALRDLYDSIGRSAPPAADENPAIVFDRSAEKVCRGCSLCELCWQKDYTGTFNAMNDATPYLLERGRALAKDFPEYFTGRCIHLPDLLAAINAELSAFLLRRQYRRQLEETRRSARGQYAQLSELLTATAAGLEAAAPAMAAGSPCRVGAALRPKEGETVCGDTVASFRTDQGLWCLLLADGMGSGEPARKESALVCRLLQQFLEAGVAPEAALKTLNSAMGLRGAESGAFTTVDLCVYDPRAREASFYKCGAAPSYLKRGGVVRRVTGASLPVGLQGPPPDVTKAPLAPGGFAVMVSDGVADPAEDEWLLNLLAGWIGDDPQDLAGLILAESVRREKLRDDCGVQVLYCPETEAREV